MLGPMEAIIVVHRMLAVVMWHERLEGLSIMYPILGMRRASPIELSGIGHGTQSAQAFPRVSMVLRPVLHRPGSLGSGGIGQHVEGFGFEFICQRIEVICLVGFVCRCEWREGMDGEMEGREDKYGDGLWFAFHGGDDNIGCAVD